MSSIIKICGITSVEDARMSLDAGADWIGLNLFQGPRKLDDASALRIVQSLPDPGRVVVLAHIDQLLADCDDGHRPTEIESLQPRETKLHPLGTALRGEGVRRIQPYGQSDYSTVDALRGNGWDVLWVQHISTTQDIERAARDFSQLRGGSGVYLLCDAAAEAPGGTGVRANWDAISSARKAGMLPDTMPLLLAGGLTAENVDEAIRHTRPSGVDVSSGVEASPGRKDGRKIAAFVKAVQAANLQKE